MDHKLAIVILPQGFQNAIQTSGTMLERFQKVPTDSALADFEQKFRYKRVGGWFDGLLRKEPGTQRWSTILRMLFEGSTTNIKNRFSGYGEETRSEIQNRIEADNTLALSDISPLAPCTIIVTPDGEWFADANPDDRDEAASAKNLVSAPAWDSIMAGLVQKYSGFKAVAWDLSWNFLGVAETPDESKNPSSPRRAGFSHRAVSNTEAWRARIALARSLITERPSTKTGSHRDATAALERLSGGEGSQPVTTGAVA